MSHGKPGAPRFPWTDELEDEICEVTATSHKGLEEHCKDHSHWPNHDEIYKHLYKSTRFSEEYDKAKVRQQDALVDYMMRISKDYSRDTYQDGQGNERPNMVSVARDKLQADNIKWAASRLSRKYREKQIIEQNVTTHEASLKDLS